MRMNVPEYAEHRGCDPDTIRNALLVGRILRNPDGTIDPEIADAQWEQNTRVGAHAPAARGGSRPSCSGATEPTPGMGYAEARALREVYEAQRRKLELQVRTGELIARKEVEQAAFTRFRNLRDAAFNLPARLAALVAAETDERTVYALLDRELRRVFEDFAEGKP